LAFFSVLGCSLPHDDDDDKRIFKLQNETHSGVAAASETSSLVTVAAAETHRPLMTKATYWTEAVLQTAAGRRKRRVPQLSRPESGCSFLRSAAAAADEIR